MSINYATALARDRENNQAMQEFAVPKVALARNASENNSTSSVITLTDNTSTLEVAAVGALAAIKWIATTNTNPSVITAAASANFDNVVPAGSVRRFVVPIESQGVSSIVGINKQAGLYNRVAVIGAASVFTTQY